MAGGLCRIVCVLLALCLPSLAQAGPQCYSCQHVKNPMMCDTKVECRDNEECYVEETASESREIVYNKGCETRQVCAGHAIGRRDVSQDLVTCFKCCEGSLCNAANCSTLCPINPCQNNATCVSDRTGAHSQCQCRPGYVGDYCETVINQCASAPCKNGGTCRNHVNDFSCECPPGYSGNTCAAKTSPSTCFECNGVDDPNHCTRRVTCPRGETCFTDALIENGIMSFNQGCRPIEVCIYYESLTGSRHLVQRSPHNLAVCSECCADDLCNGLRCLSAVHHFTSCKEYFNAGYKTSGSYQIYLNDCGEGFYVYCDMTGTGGPWTVIQRRKDGSVDFHQLWLQYAKGFGNLEREFWLGNDHIHCLTQSGLNELRIEMTDWQEPKHFAQYYPFSVGDSTTNYTLTVSNYTGDAGDSFLRANGQTFLTTDAVGAAAWWCNSSLTGGWWFPSDCDSMMSNLNGVYGKQGDQGKQFVTWSTLKPDWDSLKFSEMKLK